MKKILISVCLFTSINCMDMDKRFEYFINLIEKDDLKTFCKEAQSLSAYETEILRKTIIKNYSDLLKTIINPCIETGLYNAKSKILGELERGKWIFSALFTKNGKYLFLGDDTGVIKIFNIEDINNLTVTDSKEHEARVSDIVESHDSKYILTTSFEHSANLYNFDNGKLELASQIKTEEYTNSAAISHNNKFIILGCYAGKAAIYSIENPKSPIKLADLNIEYKKEREEFSEYFRGICDLQFLINSVGFNANDRFALINSHLWDITNPTNPIRLADNRALRSCTFVIDSNKILVNDEKINFENCKDIQIIKLKSDIQLPSSFSANGKYLACKEDEAARIYNISNLNEPIKIAALAPKGGNYLNTISPDGNFALTTLRHSSIMLWDISWPINRLDLDSILLLIKLAKLNSYNNEIEKDETSKEIFSKLNDKFQNHIKKYFINIMLKEFLLPDLAEIVLQFYGQEEKDNKKEDDIKHINAQDSTQHSKHDKDNNNDRCCVIA